MISCNNPVSVILVSIPISQFYCHAEMTNEHQCPIMSTCSIQTIIIRAYKSGMYANIAVNMMYLSEKR